MLKDPCSSTAESCFPEVFEDSPSCDPCPDGEGLNGVPDVPESGVVPLENESEGSTGMSWGGVIGGGSGGMSKVGCTSDVGVEFSTFEIMCP